MPVMDSRRPRSESSGSGDAGTGWALAFGLSQLIAKLRSLGAIFFSFHPVLHRDSAAQCVDRFYNGPSLALARTLELIHQIALVEGIGLHMVNLSAKILDFLPALRLRNGNIADRSGGILQIPVIVLEIVGQTFEIIAPLNTSLIGGQPIPGQSPAIVGLNALAELIHPAQLVFRVPVSLRSSFYKPGLGLWIVGLHTRAVLEDIADIFLSLDAAVFCGLVKPGKSHVVIL